MSEYLQFQFRFPAEEMTILEESIGDCIAALWWDETGSVNGVVLHQDRIELKERLSVLQPSCEILFSPLEQKDWLLEDQQDLTSLAVGRFFLYPPHFSGEIPPEKISFEIDSPHAFGSGHHETTHLCLQLLEELAGSFPVSRALDIGTGSGILAMAIAALWRCPVDSTDCDPLSVAAARKNVSTNQLLRINVFECRGLEHSQIQKNIPYDLIIANIHSDPLIELAPTIRAALSGKGHVVLSGILEEQASSVISTYTEQGMVLEKKVAEGQWLALQFKSVS